MESKEPSKPNAPQAGSPSTSTTASWTPAEIESDYVDEQIVRNLTRASEEAAARHAKEKRS